MPIDTRFGIEVDEEIPLDSVTYKLQLRKKLEEVYALACRTMQISAQKSK